MTKWAVSLIFLCFSNKILSQKKLSYTDKSFLYTLIYDSTLLADSVNYLCPIKAIVIQGLQNKNTVQTIYPEENSSSCSLPEDEIFIIEDINFDGYNDIRLLQFLPAAPNLPYYYWTYDSKTKKFKRRKDFEDITSPQFDKKKLIYSFWRASGYDHGSSTYKFIDGKPTLIEVVEEKEEDEKIITTIKRRVNGKMKLITKTVGKAE